MRRIYLFIVVVFGMATVALAQTTSSDSQTLQALLGEVHQLRQDFQTHSSNFSGYPGSGLPASVETLFPILAPLPAQLVVPCSANSFLCHSYSFPATH
jgi:hypothetical protein